MLELLQVIVFFTGCCAVVYALKPLWKFLHGRKNQTVRVAMVALCVDQLTTVVATLTFAANSLVHTFQGLHESTWNHIDPWSACGLRLCIFCAIIWAIHAVNIAFKELETGEKND